MGSRSIPSSGVDLYKVMASSRRCTSELTEQLLEITCNISTMPGNDNRSPVRSLDQRNPRLLPPVPSSHKQTKNARKAMPNAVKASDGGMTRCSSVHFQGIPSRFRCKPGAAHKTYSEVRKAVTATPSVVTVDTVLRSQIIQHMPEVRSAPASRVYIRCTAIDSPQFREVIPGSRSRVMAATSSRRPLSR